MEIKQIQEENRGRFKAIRNNEKAGEIIYTWAGQNTIIIDHTEVAPNFRARGIAKKLLAATIDFAKENKLKVIPLCSFAKNLMEKTPEFQKVMA
ncbi:hypothetical protein SAMN05444483_10812 [Salegentibacter echinorum]|uniref:Uncharacterized protein n=1 Tax=Salegentibacter echinorum TaxID=1073325 RepID=A0A1M5IJM3_SALEC|nr:GNAT family N-acetyltransferase [Salegentibacter echinorum]SHG28465.1 hypothetical protein SAMN05444483_10812 [Salegentibacter echinorum]